METLKDYFNRMRFQTIAVCVSIKEKIRIMKKATSYFAFIYLLSFSSLIRANVYYHDDIAVNFNGIGRWNQWSRYLADFLANVFHGSRFLSDISPMPQLIAILFLALSSTIVIYIINEQKTVSTWQIIAALPLGISPYFLECISYKFDSPYMALSILVSVAPLLLSLEGRNSLYGLVSFLGTIAMCTTYQASSGIYPMFVVLLCFLRWNKGEYWEKTFRFLGVSILSYCTGILFFRVLLMRSVESYASTSLPRLDQIVSLSWEHLKKYYSYVWSDFRQIWLVLIIICAIFFLYTAVCNSNRPKLVAMLVAVFTLAVMASLAFGLYPILSAPLYAPRAMYGFGVLIALICVPIASSKRFFPAKITTLLLGWLFFVFSLSYGNILYEQSKYADFRVANVIQSISEMDIFTTNEVKTIYVTGAIGRSPILSRNFSNCQLVGRLISDGFTGYNDLGICRFANYYRIKNINVVSTSPQNPPSVNDLPVLKNNMYFTLYKNNKDIILVLK